MFNFGLRLGSSKFLGPEIDPFLQFQGSEIFKMFELRKNASMQSFH